MEKSLGWEDFEKIVIDSKDEVQGFYTLLTNGTVVCFPDNEYIVPKSVLSELVTKGIKFELKKKE